MWQTMPMSDSMLLSLDLSCFALTNETFGTWSAQDYDGKFILEGKSDSLENAQKHARTGLLMFVLIQLLLVFSREEIIKMLDAIQNSTTQEEQC